MLQPDVADRAKPDDSKGFSSELGNFRDAWIGHQRKDGVRRAVADDYEIAARKAGQDRGRAADQPNVHVAGDDRSGRSSRSQDQN